MTRDELLQIIAEVQKHKSELEDVEVKSAHGGTPKRLYESLSAFANRSGGGLMLFGLDEQQDFEIVGVGNSQQLLSDVSDLTASEMEPTLRPEFTIEDIDGRVVVAIEIDEIPTSLKPCYYKTAGLQKGSYIRVGNSNRLMTDYEIFGYISSRMQATFDEEPVRDATMDDLDQIKLEDYLTGLKRTRPQANYLNQPFEQVLKQLRIVRDVDGVLRPTLAGLLVFGKYPELFESQLVITFLQYFGTTETEETPRGERFLDNRKFEGTIPEMIDRATNYVLASIRKSSLIEGVWRRDIPEYPEEAVREAIVNAVAHRDYSHFVRGSYIQIRLFADRLEVQSPGGLYGNVSLENIEHEQSTRNRVLIRLMEDMHLVENRGSGIRTMISVMRNANLEPPRFDDKRSSFWVTFHNHTLMNPDAIRWLNRFADQAINNNQRLALVYLRYNERITNSDYQRLNHVDSVTANRELRGLVQADLIEQNSTHRWAYYTLKVPVEEEKQHAKQSDEDKIIDYVRKNGSINNTECRDLLKVGLKRTSYLLNKLSALGILNQVGKKRWAHYVLPQNSE